LIEEGTLSKEECQEIGDFTLESYEKDLEASKMYVEKETDWLSSRWTSFKGPSQISRIRRTGNKMDFAQDRNPTRNGSRYCQMAKIFKARQEMAKVSNGTLPKPWRLVCSYEKGIMCNTFSAVPLVTVTPSSKIRIQILKGGQKRNKRHNVWDNNVQGFQRVRVKGVVDNQQAVDRVGGGSPNKGSTITAFRRPKARCVGPTLDAIHNGERYLLDRRVASRGGLHQTTHGRDEVRRDIQMPTVQSDGHMTHLQCTLAENNFLYYICPSKTARPTISSFVVVVFLTFVGWKIINCLHESMHPQVLTIGGN
jgi:hypothetical protein